MYLSRIPPIGDVILSCVTFRDVFQIIEQNTQMTWYPARPRVEQITHWLHNPSFSSSARRGNSSCCCHLCVDIWIQCLRWSSMEQIRQSKSYGNRKDERLQKTNESHIDRNCRGPGTSAPNSRNNRKAMIQFQQTHLLDRELSLSGSVWTIEDRNASRSQVMDDDITKCNPADAQLVSQARDSFL